VISSGVLDDCVNESVTPRVWDGHGTQLDRRSLLKSDIDSIFWRQMPSTLHVLVA